MSSPASSGGSSPTSGLMPHPPVVAAHARRFTSLLSVSLRHVVSFYRDVALGVQPKPQARWEKVVAAMAKVVDAAVPAVPVVYVE